MASFHKEINSSPKPCTEEYKLRTLLDNLNALSLLTKEEICRGLHSSWQPLRSHSLNHDHTYYYCYVLILHVPTSILLQATQTYSLEDYIYKDSDGIFMPRKIVFEKPYAPIWGKIAFPI